MNKNIIIISNTKYISDLILENTSSGNKKLKSCMLQTKESRLEKMDYIIEHGIFGEGSENSTNQKRENSAFLLPFGLNLGPFPKHTVLYKQTFEIVRGLAKN